LNQDGNNIGQTVQKIDLHDAPLSEVGLHISVADINGNGTPDILWTNDDHDWRFLDFSDGILNVLESINNGMGHITQVEYGFSTQENQLVESLEEVLPFPVLIVKSISESIFSQLSSRSEFKYSGGFYNGAENDFLGFHIIEKKSLGDLTVESLTLRTIFEQGRELDHYFQKSMPLKIEQFTNSQILKSEINSLVTIDTLDAFNDDKVTISFSQETIYTEFDTNSGQREYKVSKKFTLDNEGFIEKEATSTFLDLINLLRKE